MSICIKYAMVVSASLSQRKGVFDTLTRDPDITASNLLLKLTPINHWFEDDLYRRFGKPHKELVLSISASEPGIAAPRYLVDSASIVDPQYLVEDVLLVDFGQKFS